MADLDKTDPLASMLGDGYSKLDQAGKVAAAGSVLKSRDEADKTAKGEAGKRAESQIISEFGPSLYSKPYEEFKPSQESMSGFAALGSLMMVAGTMMGSKGRLAGIGAMNNIAGMLKGYQSGRKDLYEQERQQFEENMKIQERNRADIKEAFNLALKMAPTNLRGAEDFLNKTFASKGMTMPQAMLKTSGVMHTIGTVNGALDRADDITKQIADSLGYKGVTSRKDLEARIAAQAAGTTAQSAAEKATREKRLDESLIAEREAAAAEKAAKKTAATPLTDEAKRTAATQYLLGNTRVLTNLSREAKAEILNILPDIAKEKGMSQEDIVAAQQKFIADSSEARTLGSMTARTAAPAAEAQLFGQYAKELSKTVPRGKFVPVTKLIQTAEENISDPNLLAFRAATNTFINEYSRAITPIGSTTDLARKKAFGLLSTATSQEAFDRVVDVMNKEMEYAQEALKTTRGTVTGGSSAPAAPAASVSPAAPSAPVASLKDIEFTAQKYGKTVDEIKKILRDAGRKIEGE